MKILGRIKNLFILLQFDHDHEWIFFLKFVLSKRCTSLWINFLLQVLTACTEGQLPLQLYWSVRLFFLYFIINCSVYSKAKWDDNYRSLSLLFTWYEFFFNSLLESVMYCRTGIFSKICTFTSDIKDLKNIYHKIKTGGAHGMLRSQ